MKDDLIYRKDAIKLIENAPYDWSNLTQRTKMIHSFESLPAAERNCFTCGMLDGVMTFNPEKVSDEILEENDRPVMLSDVCKMIQSEWEVNPKQWGKIRSLPDANKKQCYADFKIKRQGRYHPLVYCECGRQIATTRKDKYCPKCGKKINEEEIRRKCLEVTGR